MESLGTGLIVFGVLGLLVSFIALIVALVRKRKRKLWFLSFIIFLVLAIVGGSILPTTEPDVKTKKPSRITKQDKPEKIIKKPELTEKKRRLIWKELILTEDWARKEAEKQYPLDPTRSLSIGQMFQLSKETPLMPELEPADPIVAMGKIQRLPPQTTIKILKIAMKQQTPWYFVEAINSSKLSLGSGWINSIALMGQGKSDPKEQLKKQAELENRLISRYKNDLMKKYELTTEQLRKISIEGIEKNWPFP